ncbi:hypothetical protein COU01_00710 [Candidatus Falkowbacteria bacterium CG10_big_fil_rev_8_21_14_0_10_44_15]|uniref:Uncharacterized protein n=1 Tax=Candidatus Falkowbacteria bacterium CG10_big_fil_rev_8_21_14_0_10_44_15 TaxID=1974569 RepID=A0A2H0V0N6_9BACT|nr:MAG: hypothetical protein COU01_00710 [Candidatus Falkowbacteria bacterium CG10_big_fil_rev_8_21_14_0_10_44_15]
MHQLAIRFSHDYGNELFQPVLESSAGDWVCNINIINSWTKEKAAVPLVRETAANNSQAKIDEMALPIFIIFFMESLKLLTEPSQ